MNKTNKTQQYAIQWLDSKNYSVSEISKELNITESTVIKILEKHKPTNNIEDTNIKTASSSASKTRSKNLMINQTSVKKNKSVMIMTPEASMSNDESRKNIVGKGKPNESAIFRPNNK
jgi:predicted transcriptional regulator